MPPYRLLFVSRYQSYRAIVSIGLVLDIFPSFVISATASPASPASPLRAALVRRRPALRLTVVGGLVRNAWR